MTQTLYSEKPSKKAYICKVFYSIGIGIIFFIMLLIFTQSVKISFFVGIISFILSIPYELLLLNTFQYQLLEEGIYYKGGLFISKEKSVKYSKITDVTISQDIIEKIFGIKTLMIQTASVGNIRPEIVFYGLIDADTPKNLILKKMNK
jgi:uncharacterized membrane protein YdbT with pleckstrin-like domain